MDYKDKYIKYKTKYLELKNVDINIQTGGYINKHVINDNLIIHIAGTSGSGKTTLGEKLSLYFKNNVIIEDLDSFGNQFQKKKLDRIMMINNLTKNTKNILTNMLK